MKKADLAKLGRDGKNAKRDSRLAVLENIKANRERARRRLGKDIDVLEAVDRSREAHPSWQGRV